MKVVVVGGGGREHALATALMRTADVVVTPGNPGIPNSTSTPPEQLEADLFVVGPEAPLVDGLADRLRATGKVVFGPGADGARLEGSKAWMKEVLDSAGVATAKFGQFNEVESAVEFLKTLPGFYVVKTDGLAAGKGVLVTQSLDEAVRDVTDKLSGSTFGDAGRKIVIEEGLTGPEISILAVCDGHDAVALAAAQDHKRLRDNDQGPNTGGMGAYSPVPFATETTVLDVMTDFVRPTLTELNKRGIDYRGVLYAGLMMTPDGPKMLEYNVRFGDPEAQVVLPRMTSDLAQLLFEAASGQLRSTPSFTPDVALTVTLASEGYPQAPRVGHEITGLDKAELVDGISIFHAGTKHENGKLVTSGGRVLNVTATAPTIALARRRAYEAIGHINWPGMQYRTDIATQALQPSDS